MAADTPDRDLFGEPIEPEKPDQDSGKPNPLESTEAIPAKRARRPAISKEDVRVPGNVTGNGLADLPIADDTLLETIFQRLAAEECYPDSVLISRRSTDQDLCVGAIHKAPKTASSGSKRKKTHDNRLRDAGLMKYGEWVYPDCRDLLTAILHYINAQDRPCYTQVRDLPMDDIEEIVHNFVRTTFARLNDHDENT